MSLDIWLTATIAIEAEVVSKNITHNLSEMWSEAGVYEALYQSEGKTAEEVLPILKDGLGQLLTNPVYFKQFNSSNGWGVYDNAVRWLSELIVEFQRYPCGIIGVSK